MEALALQSACYAALADLKSLESVLLRSRAAERLKAAFNLAPRNPRVVLLMAMQDMRGAKPGSPESQHAFAELQLAAHLFDESSGHEHRHAGLGPRGGVPGARPGTAGARRSFGRPQLDRKIPDRGSGLQSRAAPACAIGEVNLVSFGAMKPQGTQLSLFETRGSSDPFAVRVSPRARRLTARVHVGGRVEIVVPVGVNAHAVRDFVHRFTPWINRKVAAMRCYVAPSEPVPRVIEFAFTGENLGVEWRRGGTQMLEHHAGGIAVQAPDETAVRRLLQGWLKTAAEERLAPRLLQLAADLKYSGRARQHPLPADALGKLLDARYRQLELLPGISAPGGRALSVHP